MKITNKYGLPQSIVNAVTNDTYTGPKNDKIKISVSAIKDSPRIYFLKKNHWDKIEEDVSESLWRLLGQAVHAILERAEDKQSIVEERIEAELDGIVISGQMDILKSDTIEDYKTTSVWSIIYNPNGKDEWTKQLNIYKWLAHAKGFDIKKLIINAILRDHQSGKAKQDPTYPQIPFVSIELPVWSIPEIETYLKSRIALFKSCIGCKDNELPKCTPEDMWEKEGTWAVMKQGRKSAVKIFTNELEAKTNIESYPGCSIVHRPGARNRCEDYCPVNKWCDQYQEYKAGQ